MKEVFSTTMGLCASCTKFSSHSSHFLKSKHNFPPLQMILNYIRSLGGQKKHLGLECKTAYGRVQKSTIYTYYIYIHICMYICMCIYKKIRYARSSVYLVLYSAYFHLCIFHFFVSAHLTLKRKIQGEMFLVTENTAKRTHGRSTPAHYRA